jgi:hypothetical protein
MNPLARQHMDAAQRQNSIRFDVVADADALAEIMTLADAATKAEADEAPILRKSVRIGGITFFRLSHGAGEWFATVADGMGKDTLYCGALAFACAHSPNPYALWDAPDAETARPLVKEWMKGIGCPLDELFSSLTAFLSEGRPSPLPGDAPPSEEASTATHWGAALDLLCYTYGRSPEDWLWRTSREEFDLMLGQAIQRRKRESDDRRADPNDRAVIASHRMVLRIAALVEIVKGRA